MSVNSVIEKQNATQPHIEPDPSLAEGEARVLGKLGTGQQSSLVKPGGRLM
jgi:hypothetical protein